VLLIELGVVEGWFRCMLELSVVDGRYVVGAYLKIDVVIQ